MKFFLELNPANPSYRYTRDYPQVQLTSYERTFEERSYPTRSDHTFACALPKDFSAFSPSQMAFLYFAYFASRARVPAHLANIDWAKVDEKSKKKQENKNFENDVESMHAKAIDKSAELNQKKPQREASIKSLQTQIKETQDKINELKKLKKPTQEQQDELSLLQKTLPELESKLDTAQKSLENINQRFKVLARLYDFTTGEGLCVDLQNDFPTLMVVLENIENLNYEIPRRKDKLATLQKELQKEQDEAKKAELDEQIQNLSQIINDKEILLSECQDEQKTLSPKVEKQRKDYEQAKKDLAFLEANPLKILDSE